MQGLLPPSDNSIAVINNNNNNNNKSPLIMKFPMKDSVDQRVNIMSALSYDGPIFNTMLRF
jgi:hypothetical protein